METEVISADVVVAEKTKKLPAGYKFTPEQRATLLAEWEKTPAGERKAFCDKHDIHETLPYYWRQRSAKSAKSAKGRRGHPYTSEERVRAVELAKEIGAAEAARQLGLAATTVRYWTESGTPPLVGRRKHSPEFKAEAVARASEIGVAQAARELGLSRSVLQNWVHTPPSRRPRGDGRLPAPATAGLTVDAARGVRAGILLEAETIGVRAAAEKYHLTERTIYDWRKRYGRPGPSGAQAPKSAAAKASGPAAKPVDKQLTLINSALEKINNLPPISGHTGAVVQEFLRRLAASGVELESVVRSGGQTTVRYTITETFET